MKRSSILQLSAVCLIAIVVTNGCKSGNAGTAKNKTGTGNDSGAIPPVPPGQGDIPGAERSMIGESDVKHGMFAPLLFDYDSAKIKPSEVAKAKAVADYMKANPNVKVIVEGNTDERGTAEYNRALGEKRALAGREELVKLGVDAKRLSTISYGKDRPADPGHEDTAMSRNRRDEFGIVGQ